MQTLYDGLHKTRYWAPEGQALRYSYLNKTHRVSESDLNKDSKCISWVWSWLSYRRSRVAFQVFCILKFDLKCLFKKWRTVTYIFYILFWFRSWIQLGLAQMFFLKRKIKRKREFDHKFLMVNFSLCY